MHKSRLGALVLDCRDGDLEKAAEFWGKVLGAKVVANTDPQFQNYALLEERPNDPMLIIQKVDHESRIHLDIETDDIEAEADRLEALGAKRIERLPRWWVMEAPTGHRFCIINAGRQGFEDRANTGD
jgi:catechol 2,3-dioxygenase-like lactoylglutathione lyase family enzyme